MDFKERREDLLSHKLQIKLVEHHFLDGFGYGVSVTPMQTLTFYNAVANNGVMVKPHFVSEIKEWNRTIKKWRSKSLIKDLLETFKSKSCSSCNVKRNCI
jgi:cell division protein FtsI/penicillin-binding protein 2